MSRIVVRCSHGPSIEVSLDSPGYEHRDLARLKELSIGLYCAGRDRLQIRWKAAESKEQGRVWEQSCLRRCNLASNLIHTREKILRLRSSMVPTTWAQFDSR